MAMASTADLVDDMKEKPATTKPFKSMTFRDKVNFVKDVITVEPIIAAYAMASFIAAPGLLYLEFEKTCRSNFQYNRTICEGVLKGDALYNDVNNQLQLYIGKMHSWQGPVQSFMPLILILFLGSYSDRHQLRKPFIIIPILGEFFAVIGCILCVVFMDEWPLEVQGVVQTVVPSLFGGQPMVIMACFAYIADTSTIEMRTLRIGALQIVLNVCSPIGQALSGILFTQLGYYGILIIATICFAFAVLYAHFGIKEPKSSNTTSKSLLADIFDVKHAKETFDLLLKKSEGNNRVMIVIIMFVLFTFSLVGAGEVNVLYFYVQKAFGWQPEDYSTFLTTNTLIHLFGTLAALPLFTKYLGMGDLSILIVTFIDKILANIIFGVGKTASLLYVGAAISLLTGISNIAIRSIATKIVSPDDLGKAQSLFGICEAVAAQALAAPVYNSIYLSTSDDYPTMYFYFGLILYGLITGIIIWVYYKMPVTESIQPAPPESADSNNKLPEDLQMTHI